MAILDYALEDDCAIIASARNVTFAGWRNAARAEHIREWHRVGRNVARQHRGTGACIDIIKRGTPIFAEDMRKEAEAMARDPNVFELGVAHVVLMPGLAGTAVRLFIGTIALVARPPAPTKTFGEIPDALDWLGPKLAKHGWTRADLSAACEELALRLDRTP